MRKCVYSILPVPLPLFTRCLWPGSRQYIVWHLLRQVNIFFRFVFRWQFWFVIYIVLPCCERAIYDVRVADVKSERDGALVPPAYDGSFLVSPRHTITHFQVNTIKDQRSIPGFDNHSLDIHNLHILLQISPLLWPLKLWLIITMLWWPLFGACVSLHVQFQCIKTKTTYSGRQCETNNNNSNKYYFYREMTNNFVAKFAWAEESLGKYEVVFDNNNHFDVILTQFSCLIFYSYFLCHSRRMDMIKVNCALMALWLLLLTSLF